MKIFLSKNKLIKFIQNEKDLGFVPTMGALHKGHLKLIKKSINRSQKTLVSIYVNPTQFNKKKDFSKYPRNTKRDLQILNKQKVDFVFLISLMLIDNTDNVEYFLFKFNLSSIDKKRILFLNKF